MRKMHKERAQGATEYLLILAAVLVIVAAAVYYVTRPSFPPMSVSAVNVDNEIRINVESGEIPTGDWQYSVSGTKGSYSWTDGTEKLDAPYVSLGTYAARIYYVSLKHKPTGHLYFSDTKIEIS